MLKASSVSSIFLIAASFLGGKIFSCCSSAFPFYLYFPVLYPFLHIVVNRKAEGCFPIPYNEEGCQFFKASQKRDAAQCVIPLLFG